MECVGKQTNDIFKSYNQMKSSIDQHVENENKLKLEIINQSREIICLRNKITV